MTQNERIQLMTHLVASLITSRTDNFLNYEGHMLRTKEDGIWKYPLLDAAEIILQRIEEQVEEENTWE